MKPALAACVICLAVTALHAQDRLRYVIPNDTFKEPTAQARAAMIEALCDGKVEEGVCDTCPESSPGLGGGFSLNRVIPGHFLAPDSVDAFVTVSGCEQMHASIGWGFLLTQREGEWEAAGEILGLNLDHCHGMRFASGSELLVCEDYRMESFQLMHNVGAVFAKDGTIAFQSLLTAADTTRLCDEQARVQKAQIDSIVFRALEGVRQEVSFTASFGTLADSKRRQKLCDEAEAVKSGIRRPEPLAMKIYRVKYLFDGRQFVLTRDSEAAAKLFEWEN